MGEVRTNVKVQLLRMYCDDCGGEMESTARVFPSDPFQYEFKCNKCGKVTKYTRRYPSIVFFDEESGEEIILR